MSGSTATGQMGANSAYARGSEWREWTCISIHLRLSLGQRKVWHDKKREEALVDEMVAAMNAAAPAVYALQDYWTFDGGLLSKGG